MAGSSASGVVDTGMRLVVSLTLAVYLRTAYPTVAGGDTGELVVAACNLAVAHPPGYPLFTMLANFSIRHIPFGSPAWRVGVLSALCGSLAAGFIYATIREFSVMLFRRKERSTEQTICWAGVFGASMFALSKGVWLYSVQGEVFALNNLLVSLLIYCTVVYFRSPSTKHAYLGAFVCGLSLTNQHTAVFPVVVTVVCVLIHSWRRLLRPTQILCLSSSFLLGLSPYSYLYIVALRKPMSSWGDQRTLSGFLRHFLRQEYGTFRLGADDALINPGLLHRLWVYGDNLTAETFYLGPLFAVYGVAFTLWNLSSPQRSDDDDSVGVCTETKTSVSHCLSQSCGAPFMANCEEDEDEADVSDQSSSSSEATPKVAEKAVRTSHINQADVVFKGGTTKGANGTVHLNPGIDSSEVSSKGAAGGKQFFDSKHNSRRSALYIFVSLAASYVIYIGVFHSLANLSLEPLFLGVQARFWMQANIYVAIFVGVGYQALSSMAGIGGYRFLRSILVVLFVAFQIQSNIAWNDHSNEYSIREYGFAMLTAAPEGAILLVNGDINNNAVSYLNQCEGIRPDVSVVGVQQMTWEWFVPMQRRNYANVTFPGNRYHPNVPKGFSMGQFFKANIRKHPIVLCGPFKENDDSWQSDFTTTPLGLCERIERKHQKPLSTKALLKSLKRSERAMPRLSELGSFSREKHTAETWEHLVHSDVWTRYYYLGSLAAFHASQDLQHVELLAYTKRLHDRLYFANNTYPHNFQPLADHYRSAGVIYGEHSKHFSLKLANTSDDEALKNVLDSECKMFVSWTRFLEMSDDDPTVSQSTRSEIERIIDSSINPYRQTRLELPALLKHCQ